jgi:2-phospho-L-lactate guanylyltransferase
MPAGAAFHAIVPLKAPAACKSRLVAALPGAARQRLVEDMLHAVLRACRAARHVQDVTVMAQDAAFARAISPGWVSVVAEPAGSPGLGAALAGTLDALDLDGAGNVGVAVIMADLPMLDGRTLDSALSRLAGPAPALVVPDQHGTGTSMLAWRAARFRDFRYGPQSFQAHLEAMHAAGLVPFGHAGGAAFHDIDTAADIDALRRLADGRRRRSATVRELAA